MSEFSAAQKDYMDGLFERLTATFNNKTQEIKTEFKSQLGELKQEFSNLINGYDEKIFQLEDQNKNLQNNIVQLQRRIRKNNVVIFGINSSETNLLEYILNLFKETLEIETYATEINDVYRIGPKDKPSQPVIVEFISYQKKLIIQKNAKKLKGKNLSITQDQCYEDRATHKILYKHLIAAKTKGIQAYIKGNKIVIGNEIYTTEDLEHGTFITTSIPEISRPVSAPSTPNPHSSQKRQLIESPPNNEEEKREQKKTKSDYTTIRAETRIVEDTPQKATGTKPKMTINTRTKRANSQTSKHQ